MTGSDAAALRGDATTRGRKRKKIRNQPGTPEPVERPVVATEEEKSLRAGWRVIAAKEFSDHILSVRFLVLTVILGLAAAAAVYATAGAIRDIATDASGAPSLFLKLFTVSRGDIPSFTTFIAFLGPLLGIAFGFDAINGERSEGTLPRLLSQPIHRDDVINGKFVAGLSAIAIIFVAVALVVTAVGIFQLGILPEPEEIVRLATVGRSRGRVRRPVAGHRAALFGPAPSRGDIGARGDRRLAARHPVRDARRRSGRGLHRAHPGRRGAGQRSGATQHCGAAGAGPTVAQPVVRGGHRGRARPEHPDCSARAW